MEGQPGLPPPDEDKVSLSKPLSPLARQLMKRRMNEWNTATGIQPAGGEYTAPGPR